MPAPCQLNSVSQDRGAPSPRLSPVGKLVIPRDLGSRERWFESSQADESRCSSSGQSGCLVSSTSSVRVRPPAPRDRDVLAACDRAKVVERVRFPPVLPPFPSGLSAAQRGSEPRPRWFPPSLGSRCPSLRWQSTRLKSGTFVVRRDEDAIGRTRPLVHQSRVRSRARYHPLS